MTPSIQHLSILGQLVKSTDPALALIPKFHYVTLGVEPRGMIKIDGADNAAKD